MAKNPKRKKKAGDKGWLCWLVRWVLLRFFAEGVLQTERPGVGC